MAVAVTSKLFFTITFPAMSHVSVEQLARLAHRQLPDLEVIETINHLFKCNRCFENYRQIHRHIHPISR